MENSLELKQIKFAYLNGPVLKDINLTVKPGENIALLGPNGSGKTTLIKIISGILRPNNGEIKIGGTPLSQLNRRAIARRLAVVPQEFNVPFAYSVEEIVTLGRTPFLKPLSEKRERDRKIVDSAMNMVGVTALKSRHFNELSGGEKQKVILAMALAQQPALLLLDEPTVHLDINHQVQILELVRNLNTSGGLTVVAAMHDLNLAALYFNRLVLLKSGQILADGTPAQVLTKETVKNIFDTQIVMDTHPVTGEPHVIITPDRIRPDKSG